MEIKLVLQTVLPDGPHWYAGVREMTNKNDSGTVGVIRGAIWSPYFTDAQLFANIDVAVAVSEALGGDRRGIEVVTSDKAMYRDGRSRTGDGYKMRLKYLQHGMRCRLIGYSGSEFQVVRKSDRLIYLKNTSYNRSDLVVRSVNSKEIVEVIEKGGAI